MAEYTTNTEQTVQINNNVLFTDTPINGNCSIIHREGSGLVTLRGLTNQCRARFKITFGGNIALPADGDTTKPIVLAIAVNGEGINSTSMIYSPSNTEQYGNVSASVFVDVPTKCCAQISVKNTSDQPILVQYANLIVERVA